ncbi:MAG: hypothetical protein U5M51_05780 [Emticicia sp.]|nr:hypothetical protein [Emticicia sp.]
MTARLEKVMSNRDLKAKYKAFGWNVMKSRMVITGAGSSGFA